MESPIKVKEFKDLLFNTTGFIDEARGGEEIISYCPYCETKKFNTRNDHGHLYVNILTLKVNCYKCKDARGNVLGLFKKLNVNPKDYILDESILVNWKNYIRTRRTKENFDIVEYEYKEDLENIVKYKKMYLQQRLGSDYNLDRINRLVFSIKKFLNENKIFINENDKRMLDFLESNFVGVIGNRGTVVNLRNIDPKSDFRYFNLAIKEKSFFKDFYGIRTGPIRKEKNTIVLCEGIFDLLNAIESEKFNELKKNSCFWASGFGTGYLNSLYSVIDYIKVPNINVVILSDSDMNIDKYKYIKMNPFIDNLTVYWNRFQKDFGDRPIDPIMINI